MLPPLFSSVSPVIALYDKEESGGGMRVVYEVKRYRLYLLY